jgi:O-antigen ligase
MSPAALRQTLKNLTPESVVRGLLLVFAFSLPLLYDLAVPEVAGDIRWTATHLVAGVAALILVLAALWRGRSPKLAEHTPWIYIFSVGLAVWAAVSLIDSINIYRGIMMIKAIYAQLLLIPVAAAVWKPGFSRRLMWALALPVAFTSWLGICQFFGLSDTQVAGWLTGHHLGMLAGLYPAPGGPVDLATGYYQQSAVPGSTFANKNLAGSWTAMMLPLIAYLLATGKRPGGKAVASLLLAIGMLFLVYSRARASWVALLAGILVTGAVTLLTPAWRRHAWATFGPRQWLWLLPTVLLLAWGSGAISPVTGAHSIGESVADNAEKLANPTYDDVGGRVAYNLNSLAIVRDYWFNGVGLGAFHEIYPPYYNALVVTPKNSYNVLARPQRSHSDLVQAFDEMGIPGGLFYVAVFLWGVWAAWRLRAPGAVARVGIWPLFAGWSLVTVGINALMDFPMQLPTAPADAVLLLGGLLWHRRQVTSAIGPRLPVLSGRKLGRVELGLAALVLVAAQAVACCDSYYYRQANIVLKAAMIRIFSNVNDDTTLQLIEQANAIYPYDPRIHEHMAVVYANYSGKLPLSLEQRIGKVEWELKEDPWGANHMINLAGLYLQLAQNNAADHPDVASSALNKANQLYYRLLKVADFSHYTYGVGGMVQLLAGHPRLAVPLFERALAIEPTYQPAQLGLQRAQELISASQK